MLVEGEKYAGSQHTTPFGKEQSMFPLPNHVSNIYRPIDLYRAIGQKKQWIFILLKLTSEYVSFDPKVE